MEFTDEWKAYFPIGSVPCPPLLLPDSVVRSTVGPLLFSPSPGTRRTLSSSPCNTQVKSDDFSSNNNLGFLKCPDNDILVFFPTGDNLHKLGRAKLSLNEDETPKIYTSDCDGAIVKIKVNSIWEPADFASREGLPPPPSVVTLGYLLACTTYSVRWFRIDWDCKQHVLVNLGSEQFSASVLHACLSPLVKFESLVLLDSGELILFDWSPFPERTSIDVEWKDSDSGTLTSDTRWLSCEFGAHPRIFVIACSDVVYLVNGVFHNKYMASIVAKIESFTVTHEPDEFVTFCRAGSGGLNFSIASRYGLYLIDTRKPLSPVLQWVHLLNYKPTYMQVFKLSELRSKVDSDKYRWATRFGFAILLGSFLDDDFSFFFFGPPLPAPPESVASKVADLCHTLYAWGYSAYVSLSGPRCYCGDCLARKEASNARCRKIMGFCIITEDHLEPGVGGSFGLIRLLPSGKIESETYSASWEFDKEHLELEPAVLSDEDFHTDLVQRDKYRELDYLISFLDNDLFVKVSKGSSNWTQLYTQEKYKYLHDLLKAAGVDQIGSLPDIVEVLTSVSVPTSINEIAVSRMWTGLSIGALQLGFSSYPELPQIKLDFKRVSMDFLRIPKSPQLPPFLLRKPSRRNIKSQKVLPGDDLVGPVLPLPVLVNLHKVEKEMGTSAGDKNEENEFPLTLQCNEIMRVANVMGLPGSLAELHDSHAVSLDDDVDENSSVSQEVKSLVFYKPASFTSENRHSVEQSVREDTSATFIMKENKSDLEMLDDLCPIELKFDSPTTNAGKEELEALKLLKRQLSSWQSKYKPYQALVGCPSV
ncbi:hypothetical protein MKX03_019471 [Papaver bracteatum]|nr:hypothetical protein MKX03_019471 [Papaver bracteatum]